MTEANQETCPKCGSALSEIITTKSGKRLQRCSAGVWNETTRQTDGCNYVKWLAAEPQALDEKCPKCGAPLLLATTKFNKRFKRCSTNVWDPKTRTASGCDYVEWLKASAENLDEDCPKCGSKLVLVTTTSGKRLKRCSTSQWDRVNKKNIGCEYIEWLK